MNGTRTKPVRRTVSDRFWEKVAKAGPEDCWPWTGYVSKNGYGLFWSGEAPINAHVQSFKLAHGRAAEGDVDHTCHNDSGCTGGKECAHRACVNPAHLEDVPHRVNMQRGQTGKRKARRAQCMRGHALTPENTAVNKAGDRLCRTCKRVREMKRRNDMRSK